MEKSSDPMPSLENRIGFHQTMGVADVLVLTGEIVFLVDREEVRLRAGDLVVERGTMHSWRNEGDTPVGLLVTLVSAERRSLASEKLPACHATDPHPPQAPETASVRALSGHSCACSWSRGPL